MINLPILVFLNTHGIFLLVLFIVAYELLIAKRLEVASHIILSTLAVLVFTVVLKELYLIPRPYIATATLPSAGLANFSSLPSTHTAVAFVLATTVALHQKNLGVFLFTIASLIGIGRVAANVHYPLDIIVGILVGVLTGVIFNQIHISATLGKKKQKKRS